MCCQAHSLRQNIFLTFLDQLMNVSVKTLALGEICRDPVQPKMGIVSLMPEVKMGKPTCRADITCILQFQLKKKFFLILYWNIVDLQCCVSFRYAAMWFSYTYTYICDSPVAQT